MALTHPSYLRRVVPIVLLGALLAALAPAQQAVGWGYNSDGQTSVPTAARSGVVAVAAGEYHSLAVRSDGSVVAWGSNSDGQLNVPVAAQSGVVAVAAGLSFSLALRSDGRVVAWGSNGQGQTNVPPAAQSGVVAVAAGLYYSLALKSDGSVVAWGYNGQSQTNVPPSIAAPGSKVAGIAAGGSYCLALYELCQMTFASSTVWSGDASVGTVRLVDPAPVGGAVVSLASDDAGVHVPASVTVPAGSRTATFMASTDLSFNPDRAATVTAGYGGISLPASLTIKGYAASVAFDHPDIAGGSTTGLMLKVGLGTALGTDAEFAIAFSGPILGVPATVTVPAGTTEVKIPLTTSAVAAQQTASASLFYQGTVVGTANILVQPTKGTIKFAASTVASGSATTGTVYLSAATLAPVTVQLASGDPLVSVPASVTVAAGQRTADFAVSTTLRLHTADVAVTATIGSVSFSKDLRVSAATSVKSLTGPTAAYGGGKATFTLTLTRPAGPGGYAVTLATFGTPLSAPPSATVPEGATSVTFEAAADDVSALASGTVAAMGPVNGVPASVSVRPNVPAELSLSANAVASGGSLTGTVTLKAAVAVDTLVQLSSGDPLVAVPATVTVPAGSKTATFAATAGSASKSKNVQITATKNGVSVVKGIKVLP